MFEKRHRPRSGFSSIGGLLGIPLHGMMTTVKHTMEVWIVRELKLEVTDRAKERILEIGPEVTVFEGVLGAG